MVQLLTERIRSCRGVMILGDGLEEVTTGREQVFSKLSILGMRADLEFLNKIKTSSEGEAGQRPSHVGDPETPGPRLRWALVVSSRPSGYPDLNGFTRTAMVAFGAEQQHAFVDAWYASDPAAVSAVERRLADPEVSDLARVPLLLALLCLAFDPANPNAVATTRDDLLSAAVDHLLAQPDREPPGRRPSVAARRRLLGHIAAAYADAGWPLWLDELRIRHVLQEYPDPVADQHSPSAMALLQALEDGAGLLVREGDAYRWIHPSSVSTLPASTSPKGHHPNGGLVRLRQIRSRKKRIHRPLVALPR